MGSIKDLVDKHIEDGVMTREEHEEFIARVHHDGVIDEEESEQISRIFKLIQEGKLRIVDEMREKFDRDREKDESAIAGDDS
ncbi:MAG: hypothetical protein KDD44_04895, partial [Bdellovibrionales bacterium]|nr:hypothetical protein [Bdellovibrionales bacterium]